MLEPQTKWHLTILKWFVIILTVVNMNEDDQIRQEVSNFPLLACSIIYNVVHVSHSVVTRVVSVQ